MDSQPFTDVEEEFFRTGDEMSAAALAEWSETAAPARTRAPTEPPSTEDDDWDWQIAVARARATTHAG